jgi:F-type H+-transporting ATPase subunit b
MTFNVWTFLFQLFNFAVLAYVLHRLLYRPLRTAIDERQQANAKAAADAELARREAGELEKQLAARMAASEQERQKLVQAAHDQAETERKAVLADAERTVARRLEEFRQNWDHERAEAVQQLRTQLTSEAIDLAGRLVHEAAELSLHDQLARRLLETLNVVPEQERQRLCRDWKAEDGAVLETAADLSSTVVQRVTERVRSLTGMPTTLRIEKKPALLGGVRLRIGGHVWDASLAGRLEEVRHTAGDAA